jgi:hypothetical protein
MSGYASLTRPTQLAQAGVTDFDRYAVDPGRELLMDLFLD